MAINSGTLAVDLLPVKKIIGIVPKGLGVATVEPQDT